MAEGKESPILAAGKKFWLGVGHFGNAQTLFQLFISSGAAAVVGKMMPASWQTPAPLPWFILGSVFFGSWFTVAAVVQVAIPAARRWWHPHSLTMLAHGGDFAAVQLEHDGEPALWTATIRIVRTVSGETNPDPLVGEVALRKGSTRYQSLRLRDGEQAHIILANILYGHELSPGAGYLAIINDYNRGQSVPDSGTMVELVLTADPPSEFTPLRRCYQVSLVRTKKEIVLKEVSCD